MTKRTAIRILMLSPIYFRLDIRERMELIHEFLRLNSAILTVDEVEPPVTTALKYQDELVRKNFLWK